MENVGEGMIDSAAVDSGILTIKVLDRTVTSTGEISQLARFYV